MSVVARAEIEVDQPLPQAFNRLSDYRTWKAWMPRAFWPLIGPARELAVGDALLIALGGALPMRVHVKSVSRDSEIAWRGGVPGLLVGEHRFVFERTGEGRTRVRSEEVFTGLLAMSPLGALIEYAASAAAVKMLQGFNRSLG